MSKRRKARKKKQKQRLVATVLAVVAGISLLAVFIVYTVFIRREPPATFFPENPVFYSRFDLTPSLGQARSFLEVSQKFENPEIFSDFVVDFIFGNVDRDQFNLETEDLVGWVGDEVSIGNISTSDFDTSSVMVVHVKNNEKVQEFLENLNDQLRKRGDAINEVDFRNERIVNITGRSDISYAVTRNYLLVANSESGIKKMLDVHFGVERSLDESVDYNNVEKALRGDGEMVFFYYDLLEFAITILDNLNLGGSDELLNRLGYGATLPSGFVLIPEGDGFKTRILAHEGEGGEENFEEKLTKFVPHDLVFYLEGNNLSEFAESILVGDAVSEEDFNTKSEGIKRAIELQYGFNIDDDLFPLMNEQYAFALLRGSEKGNVNAALILELNDQQIAEQKVQEIENLVLEGVKQLTEEEGRQFTTRTYDSEEYRRLNLPNDLNLDVHYRISEGKMVLTTTEDAMKTFIDLEKGGEKLADDVLFKQSVNQVDVGKSRQLIYLEPQAGLKLVGELTPFEYGFVDQELRKLESLSLKSHNTKEGVVLEGFLKIRD